MGVSLNRRPHYLDPKWYGSYYKDAHKKDPHRCGNRGSTQDFHAIVTQRFEVGTLWFVTLVLGPKRHALGPWGA